MIKCLSKEVQAKLRSGIAIFSLTQCVEELLLNSIDAAATCVAVRVDVEACKIQVLDSGFGMDREDMESVGNRYFTSKCSTVEDLENLRFYGFRGEAIASIANVANLVEISSRTSRSAQTFGKVFKDGKPLDVYEAETTRPSSGTTVVICNLFYNLPVRRKNMNSILECERIRQRIEAISLMHPSVSFTLKNDSTGSMIVQLSKSKSSYYRFNQIYGLGKSQKLREISYSYKQFEMSGYISREGHYNSSMQFLYVNSRLVLKTRLHKLINILLKKVSVVCKQKDSQKMVTTPASPSRHRASSELQGVYVINIKCHYSEYDVCIEPAKTLIEFRDWDGVLVCVEEGVRKFLTRENLVAEISSDDIQEFIEEGNLTMQATSANSNACKENDIVGSCKSACENIIEPYDIKTLRSKAVHRPLVFASNVSGSNGNENVASSSDLKEKIPLLRDRTNSRSAVTDDNSSSASNVQSLEKETNKNQPAKASEISGLCVTSDVKNNCFEECNSVTKLKTNLCIESSEDTLKQFESQDSILMDNNIETEKNIDLDPALHVEGSTACTQSEVIHAEGSTACTQSEVIHVEGNTACTQSEVIHVDGRTACTQSEVIHVDGRTACTQSEVIHVEGSTACTQSEVIRAEGSTVCTQSEVIRAEGSTACTQSEVIRAEGSTVCTQSEVIRAEGSTACTQSEVIHVEGSTACTQSEVIQLKKHNPAPQTDKAINTESVRPKLGTTGFIHHVIPVRNENENKNHEGLVRFCHRGPVSAQDIFKEKQHNLEQNTFLLKQQCCTLTMQHVKQSTSEDWRTLFSSRGDTFSNCVDSNKQSDESNQKITLSNILKTVEDFKGSMDTMVGLSTGSQTKQRSKLSLPVRIGSLDRFRRMYGKTCPYAVQYSCQDSNNNLSTAADSNPAEAKRDASTSNEEDSCSRSNNSSKNWERNDYTKEENAITLSDYTQIKKASLNTSKPDGSLATKLSKLKGYQKNNTKVQPVGDISVSGAQKDSGDLRLMHSNNSNAETPSKMPSNKKNHVTNNCLKGCESGENNIEQTVDFEGNQKEGIVISATYLHPDTGYKGCALIAPSQSDGAAQCHYCNDDKEISSKAILGSPKKVNECSDLATCKARFEDASKRKEIPSTTQSSSNWVEHFDVSVGRMAYINTVTGLSKYVAPPEKETQAICTTDITTMAVNVVSEKDDSEAAESVRTLLSEWENPVFVRHPEVALDVSSGQAESLAVKIHNILYPYRFTKEMINSMEVVQQVDNKFIACLINTRSREDTDKEGNLLVLVDQHAAHERVRLEKLVTDSYETHSEASGPKRLCSSTVCPPLEIDVTEEELRLLRSCQTFLKELALEMTFAEREDSKILVGKVPVCFIEREANELRRGRQTVTKAIVEEYLREQIALIQSTGRVRGTLPLTVLKVLASQACHGAIKFNDSLSMEECCRLIESLSVCQLPFQCAHGRPSMLPLVDLDHLEMEKQDPPKPNLMKLRKLHRAWELYGKQ
ncbi:DNA mismatch repair protein Mlh3-like isoform X2 [Acipenser ruthenus]|uniref:DNA mismatch repair protein Mlh3-like isoform X2 n=1 Tax=Acipenser ruthenus TaxID=7906 RepID=UPI002741B77E|nr:DNA mismatch repair protein Mlh3-like isoform X2 [Acipenser ruthenus]